MDGSILKKVLIYTDGACSGNPGPGGWAALLKYGEIEKTISGGVSYTTNNVMEITAVLQALTTLKEKCSVLLYTDSKYIKDGITKWIHGWKKNNWITSAKKPVMHKELWIELDEISNQHHIEWHWVKGHGEDEWNNYVDKIARAEIKKLKQA